MTGRLETGLVNISSRHPSNLPNQAAAAAAISAADVILVVESDVPWLPATVTLRADAQVFHVDPDPAKASMPLWSYPVDLAVQADGPAALAAIVAELKAIAARAARGRRAAGGPGRRGCVTARPERPRPGRRPARSPRSA